VVRVRTALASAACFVSCLGVAACGGSDDEGSADDSSGERLTLEQLWRAPGDDVAVVPGTSSYEPGSVRVSFLVVDAQGRPVTLPTARVWVARALGERPFLETSAKIERIGVPGGAVADSTHIYVTKLRLREPGTYWLLAEPEGARARVQALGNVVVARSIDPPGVGERAPPSRTPTLAAGDANADELTTRVPPDLSLLRDSVATLVRNGRPFVVVFATPKYCTSRACSPVVDVVEEVQRREQGSAVRFVHVEVYDGNDPTKGYNRWMQEWGLTTEPWTFVVGANGKVSARFEGPVSVHELEDAVRQVTPE
jgi:hypothetical protein